MTNNWKNDILEEVLHWLEEDGQLVEPYINRNDPENSYLLLSKFVYSINIKIFIRVIDELNLELTAPYLPVPGLSESQLQRWTAPIFRRKGFRVVTNEGEDWLAVCLDFRLTMPRIGDRGRLFSMVGDICRRFMCAKDDAARAKKIAEDD